jgi:3-methyladenine DNA glycosylase/8-oxoguanine DNA glycosylase
MKTQILHRLTVPFNLEAVTKTHGWFQLAPFYWQEAEKRLHWIVRIDTRVCEVDLFQIDKKTIQLSSTQRLRDGDWQIVDEKFRHVFNLDVDLAPFYRLCGADPLLRILRRRGLGRIMRAETVYEDVFKSICATNVLWKQAVKMVNNIAELGEKPPHSALRAFPTAEAILAAGEAFLLDRGRVGYRSRYLMALCERTVAGDDQARQVERGEITGSDLFAFFTSYQGIGPVTARYLAALYGSFSELAVDSAVFSYMAKTHFNGRKPTALAVQQHYARFGEWRYLAYWMEFIVNRGWVPEVS